MHIVLVCEYIWLEISRSVRQNALRSHFCSFVPTEKGKKQTKQKTTNTSGTNTRDRRWFQLVQSVYVQLSERPHVFALLTVTFEYSFHLYIGIVREQLVCVYLLADRKCLFTKKFCICRLRQVSENNE